MYRGDLYRQDQDLMVTKEAARDFIRLVGHLHGPLVDFNLPARHF